MKRRNDRTPAGICHRCKGLGRIREKIPEFNTWGGFRMVWHERVCERCQGRGRV